MVDTDVYSNFRKTGFSVLLDGPLKKIVFCYMNQQELLNGLILKWGVVIVMFLYKILVRHWIVFSAMRTKTFCMVFPEQRFIHEYSCAVTPQVRQTGNRLSGLAGTAYASLLT